MKNHSDKTNPEIVLERMKQDELHKAKGRSMAAQHHDDGMARLPRVSIDFKIPLWGIMGSLAVFLTGLASMYFQLARVADDVTEMKATMKVNNSTTIQFAQEQALLKFRVEKLEENKERR